jgi:hypothetical protein
MYHSYDVPRKIMDYGYELTDAIRTNISFLKIEKRLIHKTNLMNLKQDTMQSMRNRIYLNNFTNHLRL